MGLFDGFTLTPAPAPTSSTNQPERSQLSLPSLLSDAWDTGLGIFERWVDHELGLGEAALSAEGTAHAAAIQQQQAPAGGGSALQVGAMQFSVVTLGLVAALGLLVLYVLRD